MTNRKTYDSLDAVKWISALLIIIIHANPFCEIEVLDFYIKDVLARIAVPMFFAISGFLFFRKIAFQNGKIARSSQNIAYLIHYVKHLIIIYLGASAFYLLYKIPMWYSTGWWGFHALKDYLVNFFFSGSEYHLWYILASIYGIVLFYILLSFIRIEVMKYLCMIGWVIECLLYSYSWIGIDNINILNRLISYFSVCFDAAFRAIPLMAVGLFCVCKPAGRTSKQWFVYSLVSLSGWIAEVSYLYFLTPNAGKYSYILFTPMFAYCMMNWLLKTEFRFQNKNISKWMRDTSLIIYIVHPMVIYLLEFTDMEKGILHWLVVTLISIGAAAVYVLIKNKLKAIACNA